MLLSALYEYAINGVIASFDVNGPGSFVIDSNVIQLVKRENYWTSTRWDQIIATGNGRRLFALDAGSEVRIAKVALLAKVDLRRDAVKSAVATNKKTRLLPSIIAHLLTGKTYE